MSTLLNSRSGRDEASSDNCGNGSLREVHYEVWVYRILLVKRDSDSKGLNSCKLVKQRRSQKRVVADGPMVLLLKAKSKHWGRVN